MTHTDGVEWETREKKEYFLHFLGEKTSQWKIPFPMKRKKNV